MASTPILQTGKTTGSRFFDARAVEDLVTLPLLQESVALRVSKVIRPKLGQIVEIPVIASDSDDEPAWTPEGAEITRVSPPNAGTLTLTHYKVAAGDSIPWERLNDVSYDVLDLVGQSLVRKITATIDAAYFNEVDNGRHPISGVGLLEGTNNASISAVNNVDWALDAVEHAAAHDAAVGAFVTSPKTLTALAKIKKGTGSNESLFGTSEAPGVATLAGVPLIASRHVSDTRIWAIPTDRVIVSLRQDVTVATDPSADFGRQVAGIAASARVSMGCIDPAAVTKVTIGS
ncbi:phage major capsid protein [Corynebacterium flavescens]|uniref:Phage capsid-like C-terminal domain-containing protein n=1 Tax=Corynebacterium flavescens TaxID=28028 RepID=A0A1L7CNQ9_CORFL|nr:phage major capsid protein [Corynebacterium flavescens]APT87461.1 hypothetical protein CFLV_09985 [Corynebacterium flavescens]KAA8720555.1 phage major capsid protein [Corynebacterium flavescens]GEB97670.1 hypothetical protein CFL01nite_11650 [Corynebacterium flavescens]